MKLSNHKEPTSAKTVKVGQAMVVFGASVAVITSINNFPIIALVGGLIGAVGSAITVFGK